MDNSFLFSVIRSTKYNEMELKLHQPIADILFQNENIYLLFDIYANA